jgi:hypothetical protein
MELFLKVTVHGVAGAGWGWRATRTFTIFELIIILGSFVATASRVGCSIVRY